MTKKQKLIEYLKNHSDQYYLEVAKELNMDFSYVWRIMKSIGYKSKAGIEKTIPKILLLDLETSPMEVYVWRLGEQYINPDFVIKSSAILTWSAKWLYDNKMLSGFVTPNSAKNRIDKQIVKPLWKLFDEADIVIAHALIGFDNKFSNTRFILNGFNPPSHYRMIDTLKQCRANFLFASNKLDFLSQRLMDNKKLATNFNLWKRCVSGGKEAEKAIQEMLKYNKNDVLLLEDLYIKIRPYIKSHPNLGMYYDTICSRCPNCGSKNLKSKGKYYTNTGRYRTKTCLDCGAMGRERYQELTAKDKRELLSPIPR